MDNETRAEQLERIEHKLDLLLAALSRVEPWLERLQAHPTVTKLFTKPRH